MNYRNKRNINNVLFLGSVFLVFFFISFGLLFNPFKKNIATQSYCTTNITGTVESIHPWGRTEVVPIKGIELEYYEYNKEWVLYGDVEQPTGHKDYFMPVMNGSLDFSSNLGVQQLTECFGYEIDDQKDNYQDFRVANIVLKDHKPHSILYYHYRYEDDSWMIIASWEAKFQ